MAYEWYSKDGKELIEVRDAEGQYIIPNSVEKIYPMGLYACYELTSVIIPGTVKVIGDSAFYACRGLSSVAVPNSVTEIKKQTFQGCKSLVSIELPNTIRKIGAKAFMDCDSLKFIEIPNSITEIEENAFSYCKQLTEIMIPSSVEKLGWGVFVGSVNIEKFTVCGSSPYLKSEGGILYNKAKNEIIAVPTMKDIDSFSILDGVTYIRETAFADNKKITNIRIPESVKRIGKYAFSRCTALTSVTIFAEVTKLEVSTFADCKELKKVELPVSLEEIKEWAFIHCENLECITIPKNVKSIGRLAFGYWTKLKELHSKITNIEDVSIDPESFKHTNLSLCTLYVPIGTGYAYRHHPVFSQFKEVVIEE